MTRTTKHFIDPKTDAQTRVTEDTSENIVRFIHLSKHKFLIPYVTDKRVLDTGCGAGYGLKLLSQHYKQAVGLDGNAKAINHAQKSELPATTFHLMSLESFELDERDFDIIISVDLIQQLENPSLYLQSVFEHLAEKGQFILITPNLEQLKNTNPCHFREYTAGTLRAELKPYFQLNNIYALHKNDGSARLQTLWRLDPLKIRNHTPRWLNILIRRIFGITAYEKISSNNYPIDMNLNNAYSLIAVCEKKPEESETR